MRETLITPGGHRRLSSELERLKLVGRQEMAKRVRDAFATDADPSANADYLAAREEQAMLEARIARLEARLAAARVVEPDTTDDVVDLGERVLLHELDTDAPLAYVLVGPLEADPGAGRISAESPVGRALIGRRRGDVAVVEAPSGTRRLRIDGIHAAAA